MLDEEFELIVKNPGIPYTNPLVAEALTRKIPIITEVELAGQIAECPIVGITGTNGKTTTTTMIGLLLNADRTAGEARLAGNIGFPASTVAQEATAKDDLVMELSSFQLMGIETFHPQIAVITNIFEAHLDYHGSRKEYVAAKWAIQKHDRRGHLDFKLESSRASNVSQNHSCQRIAFFNERSSRRGLSFRWEIIFQ